MQKNNTKTQKCKCKKETANAKKIAVARRQASNAKCKKETANAKNIGANDSKKIVATAKKLAPRIIQ